MRHLFLILIAVFGWKNLSFAADNQEIQNIRKIYQQAQNEAKTSQKKLLLQQKENVAALGICERKVELFYREKQDEKQVYLIRESFNLAAQKFYREYLFDTQEKPLFFYRNDNLYSGKKEERIYYLSNHTRSIPENLTAANPNYGQKYLDTFNFYAKDFFPHLFNHKDSNDPESDIKTFRGQMLDFSSAQGKEIEQKIQAIDKHNQRAVKDLLSIDFTEDKKKIVFYFLDLSEPDNNLTDNIQDNSQVMQIHFEEDEMFVTDFYFSADRQNALQYVNAYETAEGSSYLIEYLADDKVYCQQDLRTSSANGDFEHKRINCNDETSSGMKLLSPNGFEAQHALNLKNLLFEFRHKNSLSLKTIDGRI
ncbi:MAG: hypothetical protein IJ566_06315 [Cardiobacteriaceae bacterium]|nr:hypothetical protein [Cardiobacteriaceae bacterium]